MMLSRRHAMWIIYTESGLYLELSTAQGGSNGRYIDSGNQS